MTSRSNGYATIYALDLETWALPNAEAFIDMRDISAPSNWKDPDKIAAYVLEQKAARLDKAALDFDLSRIAIAGLRRIDQATPDEDQVNVYTLLRCTEVDEEYDAVRLLLAVLEDPDTLVVGHNLLGYDLPLLDRRALEFGLPPMRRKRAPKYRALEYGIFDLQEVLSEGRPDRWRSLEWYCARYLPTQSFDDPLPGGGRDVAAALDAGRWDDVEGHLKGDLDRIDALYARMHGLLLEG